jgi:hypothetical protein
MLTTFARASSRNAPARATVALAVAALLVCLAARATEGGQFLGH